MNDYTQRLLDIQVHLLTPFTRAKDDHEAKCLICEHVWTVKPLMCTQVHRKWGSNGCPTCNENRRAATNQQKRTTFLAKLPAHIQIVSDYNGTQDYLTTRSVTFKNELCGHTFSTNPNYVINGKTECIVCGEALRKAKLQDRNDKRAMDLDERHDWQAYKSKVARYTRLTYLQYKDRLNPDNLMIAWAGVKDAYHIDHIVPKKVGFDVGIPPELISHIDNLQLLPWTENLALKDKVKHIPNVLSMFSVAINKHE